MLPMEVVDRTFHISFGDGEGTGFAIDVSGRQYLVTAKHVIEGLDGSDTIKIWCDNDWQNLGVTLVGHSDVDVSVLAPEVQLAAADMELACGRQGFLVGEDVFFAGFPLGLRGFSFDSNFPSPLLKKAMVSGAINSGIKHPFFVDGHNNPGFSGAPVFKLDRVTLKPHVIMVVASFTAERSQVLDEHDQPTGLTVFENTGIMAAYHVRNAIELIEASPLGFPIR